MQCFAPKYKHMCYEIISCNHNFVRKTKIRNITCLLTVINTFEKHTTMKNTIVFSFSFIKI